MGNTIKKAFPVLNMHCAGCANNVEKTVKKLPGVIEASVNFATNTLTVSYEKDQLTYPKKYCFISEMLPSISQSHS